MRKQSKGKSPSTPTAAGPSSSPPVPAGPGGAEGNGAAAPDRTDAINRMFAEFRLAWPNQFNKAFEDKGDLILARRRWEVWLGDFSPEVIVLAARRAAETARYLPCSAEMREACESLLGLPPAREAFHEACERGFPKHAQPWSHPAVYFAGRATGWSDLESGPDRSTFPRFEHHYAIMRRRAARGERLAVPVPEPLPAKRGKTLSGPEVLARLAKFRKATGI